MAMSLLLGQTTALYAPPVDDRDKFGYTQLHKAIDARTVRHLLRKGADIDARCDCGLTPLYYAVYEKRKGPAQVLLENKANPDAKINTSGSTPLHLAAQQGETTMIHLLLSKGASPQTKDHDGYTPLHVAARGNYASDAHGGYVPDPSHIKAMELLLENGAELDAKSGYGNTPLHMAAMDGKVEAVAFLLERGADPAVKNREGNMPLQEAQNKQIKDLLRKAAAREEE